MHHRAMAERKASHYETPSSLSGRWIDVSIYPDKAGGLSCYFREVTERKLADNMLRASEIRFRTLADAIPQLVWTNDGQGYADYFNQRWFEFSGLTWDQSLGVGWQAMVHPDDAALSVDRWTEAQERGEVFESEYRLRRADGVYRWHIGRNVPQHDNQGRVQGWFGTATDIEDLKIAEASRRESEERFRLLVEGAKTYAIFLMDVDRRIIHWNSGAERIFGYTPEEIYGKSGDVLFTPEDRAAGAPDHEAQIAITQGRALDVRWHMRKDGSLLWADGINTSLYDEAGQLRGFVKITRDATKEREAEERLQRAHDELELRVQERTAQLRNEVAQRLQAERAREQLSKRVVTIQEDERKRISRELHDQMGQQLTALLMGLKTLPDAPPTEASGTSYSQQLEKMRDLAKSVMQQTHRLAWELRPATLDTFGLEPALRRYAEEWCEHTGIAIDFMSRGLSTTGLDEVPRQRPEVDTALYRVVQEALTNVQRHANAQRVSVLLERDNSSITAIIEDDGQGFEVEQNESGIPSPAAQRLGLLGMVERMELVGGTLIIESAPGQGTTVYARVPLNSNQNLSAKHSE
jgi:PAS domain S-box-containing protein